MRIIGGRYRGRPIVAPSGPTTRPTSDRIREAIFNILAYGAARTELEGAAVIDLFAGTGALGLEALSRGARSCLFVESDAEARAAIRANIETLGLGGVTRIFRRDATDLGPTTEPDGFDLAFLDPPYGRSLGERALASLIGGGWLAPGSIVVMEDEAGGVRELPAGVVEIDRRRWGGTEVVFARCEA